MKVPENISDNPYVATLRITLLVKGIGATMLLEQQLEVQLLREAHRLSCYPDLMCETYSVNEIYREMFIWARFKDKGQAALFKMALNANETLQYHRTHFHITVDELKWS